jgi:MORN repeat variant
MRVLPVLVLLLVASPALAGVTPRPGANHHLGDDSFVVRFGRAPDAADPEPLRMRVHLEYVRDHLAARPATRPELAGRRAELLGYLGNYIAKGTTPINTYVPRRTPVFIDARGAICAVGYLIERAAGRVLPEQIARAHRLDYLEDISAAMPAVRAWIDESGFTLEELASIQPGYAEPDASEWKTWDLAEYPQPDGPYDRFGTGTMRKNRMEGEWKVVEDGVVRGKGAMRRGAGTWTSFHSNGKQLATGLYVANRAEGAWKLFHPSGNLAAEGMFIAGTRRGEWGFYYDTAAKTPIARGRFGPGGHATGTWRHFAPDGKLFATAFTETPSLALWGDPDWHTNGGKGYHLDLVAARGEVKHQIHQGTVGSEHQRLDSLSLGADRIYVQHNGQEQTIYDADGWRLEQSPSGGGWQASDCRWGATRKRIAKSGDIAYLHGLLYKELRVRGLASPEDFGGVPYSEEPRTARACRAPVQLSAARAKKIDLLLAAADQVGLASPAFVREAKLGDYQRQESDEPSEWELEREAAASSFKRVLADGMVAWIQWPHVDRLFVRAFQTMPGRFTKHWVDGDPQEPDVTADAAAGAAE